MKIKSTVAAIVVGTSLFALAGPIQAACSMHQAGWHQVSKKCHIKPAASWQQYSSGYHLQPVSNRNMMTSWMFWR